MQWQVASWPMELVPLSQIYRPMFSRPPRPPPRNRLDPETLIATPRLQSRECEVNDDCKSWQ